MDANTLTTKETAEDRLKYLKIASDPKSIKDKALKKIEGLKQGESLDSDTDLVKAMTLSEFENGVLLSTGVSDLNTTFAIDFMRKIQKEYECTTPSEKATAELAAASYARVLDLQRLLHNFLAKDSYGDLTVKVISGLGKELDRANRHYLAAIQTLRILKQPPIQLNIRADTAVVGQNQMVQTNNESN